MKRTVFQFFYLLGCCSGAAHAFDFKSCTQANGYLEEKLKSLPGQCRDVHCDFPDAPGSDLLSRPEAEVSCIALAMSRFSEKGVGYAYKKCPSAKSVPSLVDRPCISRTYVETVLDRYKAVSSCVFQGSTITHRETFPLFALESGFHLNVTSGSGCRGLGQLSKIAVQEMDAVDTADLEVCEKPYSRSTLRDQPSCAGFEKQLSAPIPDHSKKLGECEVIALPENPDANLLYSLRLYRMLKDDKAASTIQKNQDHLKSLGLTESEIKTLHIRIARAMYNGGYPSIQATFNSFIKSLSAKSLKSATKGESLWNLYKAHIYNHYPAKGQARRKEVRDYVS
ncbi:MAG: hypothetical protein EBX52_14365, partial [Proteobacteria bacterium]|nr:hypothetical protein [Pseudomonadota bacterium]